MLSLGLWAPMTGYMSVKAFLHLSDLDWLEERRVVTPFPPESSDPLLSTAGMGAGENDTNIFCCTAPELFHGGPLNPLLCHPLPSPTPSLPPLPFLLFWSHALSFPSLLHPVFLFRILVHMWSPTSVPACGWFPTPESSPWAITMPLILSHRRWVNKASKAVQI